MSYYVLIIKVMDKKTIIQIIVKVLIYALGLIATAFGISSLCSCTYSRSIDGTGRATIITTDTTVINHVGTLKTK